MWLGVQSSFLNFLVCDAKNREVWYACFMRKKYKKLINFILTVALTATAVNFPGGYSLTAQATSIDEIKNKIEEDQKRINALYEKITGWEDEQDLIQEEIDDLNSEILNTMTSIGLKEDEISTKKKEITEKEEEIVQKTLQIQETEAEYEAALAREEQLLQNIAACTRLIYESGETSFLGALLEGKGFADVLNRLDYIEKMYAYERTLLLDYMDTKDQVHDLWDRLEEEKAGLLDDKARLEIDRKSLEADKADLQNQRKSLDAMLERKKQESANYEAEIARARQEAAVAKKLLQQDQKKLNQLEEAQKLANATYATTDYTTVVDNASGSVLGKQVAKYALQYVGNPYVYGGTSLTDGADCSGFTYRVYGNFGYTLPRTSYQQRTAGVEVSYSEAQPGDLICYEGHVAMYIGSGMIVHASNSNPYPRGGIKVSRAEYKPILTVRRIISK